MAHLFVDTKSSKIDMLDAVSEFVIPLRRDPFSSFIFTIANIDRPIIDICTLKDLAFSITSTDRRFTLKSVLEDPKVPKVFFDVRMEEDEKDRVLEVKARGKHLFAPEHGHCHRRSLTTVFVDMMYMPGLYQKCNLKLDNTVSLVAWGYWARKIIKATKERVTQAQGPEFRGSPWGPW